MLVRLLAIALLAAGCEGLVLSPLPAGRSGTGGGAGSVSGTGAGPVEPDPMNPARPPPPPRFTCTDGARRGTTSGPLRRLTRPQLEATLTDLLGAGVMADPAISQALGGLPADELQTLSTFSSEVPLTWAKALSTLARRAATLAMQPGPARTRLLGPCGSITPLADDCARTFIRELGLLAARRPLDATELQTFFDFYRATGGGDDGLRFVLRRFLQDPSFTFHVETEGTDEGARVRLAAPLVAARLSYAITGSMPDLELRSAAAAGQLETPDQLRAHAARLLDTPRARARVRDLMRYYMHLGDVSEPFAPVLAARGLTGPGLGPELRDEALSFAERVFWSPGDGSFRALMTSPRVETSSPRLARIFGLTCTGGTGCAASGDDPSHPGLIHRPALLAGSADRTSPILRGAHLRKGLLCANLSTPDLALVTERLAQVGDLSMLSNRDRVTRLTDADACRGCHVQVNPLGFTLERYDQAGMARQVEQGWDSSGNPGMTWPIDTRVEQPMLDQHQGFADSTALADALATSPTAQGCFTQVAFEYLYRRPIDFLADGCALADSEAQVKATTLRDAVVGLVANQDLFYRSPGEP